MSAAARVVERLQEELEIDVLPARANAVGDRLGLEADDRLVVLVALFGRRRAIVAQLPATTQIGATTLTLCQYVTGMPLRGSRI